MWTTGFKRKIKRGCLCCCNRFKRPFYFSTASNMSTRRALHYVFKIGNRAESARFYRAIGMKFLRHEEFEEGCKASCNGPYDGKWSKSMVGYGPEDDHFVMELTYNYGLGSYKLGNDFMGITVTSSHALENVKKAGGFHVENSVATSPDGYKFTVVKGSGDSEKVTKVTLACSDLKKSTDFWTRLCGMTNQGGTDKSVQMCYAEGQCQLELVQTDQPIDRATAFGRFAISCPSSELKGISDVMTAEGQTILTPLVSLDTPGKATVEVIIVADPDGHEICFVGDEAFRELSQVDPKADVLLNEAMAADKSDEWFAKKGKTKATG